MKLDLALILVVLAALAWWLTRSTHPAAKFSVGQRVKATSGAMGAISARRYDTEGLAGWFYQLGESPIWYAEGLLTAV